LVFVTYSFKIFRLNALSLDRKIHWNKWYFCIRFSHTNENIIAVKNGMKNIKFLKLMWSFLIIVRFFYISCEIFPRISLNMIPFNPFLNEVNYFRLPFCLAQTKIGGLIKFSILFWFSNFTCMSDISVDCRIISWQKIKR
jgi:hypothetical protein